MVERAQKQGIKSLIFQNKDLTNKRILMDLRKVNPDLIIVYKGSYIFPKSIIEKFRIINIHCSDTSIENYRGLGSVYNAFKNKEKNPRVTVHELVAKIDAGKILFTKNYKFDFNRPYLFNENVAYDTGIDCFFEIIRKNNK